MLIVASFLVVASASATSVEDATQLMQATVAMDGTVAMSSKMVYASDLAKIEEDGRNQMVYAADMMYAAEMEEVDSVSACEQQCYNHGYKCKGTASTWSHPSCAMGCAVGLLSANVNECNTQCDQHDNTCNWNFKNTQFSNCQAASSCPNQDRSKSSKNECKVGCSQSFSGPRPAPPPPSPHGNSAQQILDALNKIRREHGVKPAFYKYDGEVCANRAATYNVVHGAHRCGADGPCSYKICHWRAAGDFPNAKDGVDAIIKAYATRLYEGHKNEVCDETSHCGALLVYNGIAVGHSPKNDYFTIYYYDQ